MAHRQGSSKNEYHKIRTVLDINNGSDLNSDGVPKPRFKQRTIYRYSNSAGKATSTSETYECKHYNAMAKAIYDQMNGGSVSLDSTRKARVNRLLDLMVNCKEDKCNLPDTSYWDTVTDNNTSSVSVADYITYGKEMLTKTVKDYSFDTGTVAKAEVSGSNTILGPFKITCEEDGIEEVKLGSAKNYIEVTVGDTTTKVTSWQETKNGTSNSLSSNNLPVGKEFYVKVSGNLTGKGNVTVKIDPENFKYYRARIIIVEGIANKAQSMAIIGATEYEKKHDPIQVEINQSGKLIIEKQGTYAGKDVKVANFKFKIYYMNNNSKVYVKFKNNKVDASGSEIVTTDSNGSVTLTGIDSANTYYIEEVSDGNSTNFSTKIKSVTPTNYQFDSAKGIVTGIDGKGITISSSATNPTTVTIKDYAKTGGLKVVKKDISTGNVLNGVKFKIQNSETSMWVSKDSSGNITYVKNESDATTFTTSNGTFSIDGLDIGQYKITEIEGLSGYTGLIYTSKTGTGSKTVTVDVKESQTGSYVEVEYYNKKENSETPVDKSIKVIKIDETSRAPLKGVKFKLTKVVNGKETTIGERTTDANGEITWTGLEANVTYYVQETSTLTDYELSTDKKTIKLTDSNPNQTITITNKKKEVEKSIKVIKIDETSRKPLQGVKFKLTKVVNGKETTIGERTTDANGEITWTGLEANVTYYVQETSTLTDYELSTDKKTIKLTDSNPNQTFTITNKKKTYGKIKIIKVDKNNHSKKLSGATFKVTMLKNGRETTLSGSPFTTNANGEVLIENLDREATYYISEATAPNGYKLASGRITVSFANTTQETITVQIEDEPKTVNIKIVKVDKDNTSIRLAGAVFEVKKVKDGKTTNLGRFTTNANGEITLSNVETGAKYYIHEVSAPEYYDIVDGDVTIDLTDTSKINDNAEIVKTFQNKKQVIDISGFVWIDRATGKSSTRNNLYKQSSGQYVDSEDTLFKGVKVRLVDKNGNAIKNTETNAQGEYKFSDVSAKDLVEGNYHVEFSYDGIKYEDVQKMNSNNGSKASEDYNNIYGKQTRDELNKKFASIEGNESMNNGYSTGYVYSSSNGRKSVSYLTKNNVAEVQKLDIDTTMTAETENNYLVTRYNNEIKNSSSSNKEIKYVNLGVYERDQADIAIATDLYNVKLGINGYEHVYNYNQVTVKNGANVADEDAFNVGIKFSNKYNGNYKRAIYESDYTWTNPNDTSKELKVYVTYEIALRNQSDGNLRAKITQISDYYDSHYTFVKAGTGINNGEITNEIKVNTGGLPEKKNGYNRLIINDLNETNNLSKDDKYLYIQFSVDKDTVKTMLNSNNNTLNYVVEIDSYSITTEDGKPYATIDKDSTPGNCIPGDSNTYEDDTAYAKGLTLEVANARELNGKVFLDTSNDETNIGGERLGDGEYKQPEPGIDNIKVTYKEESSGTVYEGSTGNDGNYTISGFIPGNYTITYTWGDDTYNVQDYKGTIFKELKRAEDKYWYKNTNPRYSDAKDDYSIRENIDKEIANGGDITITKMNSTSPEMSVGVEYDSTSTASNGDRYTYAINNADFGIVERPRQGINIGKKVTHIKVTLVNGQVYGDSEVDIDNIGKKINNSEEESTGIEPPIKGITMTKGDTEHPYGQIKAEIDNELIQGATIDITYEVVVKNTSELDFVNNNYYWYGTDKTNKVTIKPTQILDYLDEQMPFEENKNSAWELVEKSTYEKVSSKSDLTLTERWDSSVTQNPDGTKTIRVDKDTEPINQKTTEEEWKEIAKVARSKRIEGRNILKSTADIGELEPGAESKLGTLTASKVLSISDEIELDENHVEIAKIEKNGGRRVSVIRTANSSNSWNDWAERIIVVPPTGEDNNYVPIVIIGISVCVIFGTGIVLIKKKVLNK